MRNIRLVPLLQSPAAHMSIRYQELRKKRKETRQGFRHVSLSKNHSSFVTANLKLKNKIKFYKSKSNA